MGPFYRLGNENVRERDISRLLSSVTKIQGSPNWASYSLALQFASSIRYIMRSCDVKLWSRA